VFSSGGDAPLKALRDAECFARLVRACPLQAHWLDGQPVTPVLPTAGLMDRYRRFAIGSGSGPRAAPSAAFPVRLAVSRGGRVGRSCPGRCVQR
jgi:hypothetical protein